MGRNSPSFGWEFWLAVTLALVSAAAYAHSTFLTKDEANFRKESRDKIESIILDRLKSIDEKLDRVLRN